MDSPKLDELRLWATDMGGECLSMVYTTDKSKYLWRCGACDHEWEAFWTNVRYKYTWCPHCRSSMREIVSRAAFEENCPGMRFDKNRTAIGVELDGYCPDLCAAFEHDGIHHSQRVPYFQRTEIEFVQQQERDARKDKLCEEHEITLIRVPGRNVLPLKGIRDYVRTRLVADCGMVIPPATEMRSDLDFFEQIQSSRGRERNELYISATRDALPQGFTLVSTRCPTRTTPLTVRCLQLHEYTTNYDNIVRGRQCPSCAHNCRLTPAGLSETAAARGYTLKSSEHAKKLEDPRSRLYVTLQCSDLTHESTTMLWDNFRAGKGCKLCGFASRGVGKRNTAKELEARLNRLSIRLVGEYTGIDKSTLFECLAHGHAFTSSVKKVEMAGDTKACPACVVATYKDTFFIELQEPYMPDTNPIKTKLTWKCLRCGKDDVTTFRGMLIRNNRSKCKSRECRM